MKTIVLNTLLVLLAIIVVTVDSGTLSWLFVGQYRCEGQFSGNYTHILPETTDTNCTLASYAIQDSSLINRKSHKNSDNHHRQRSHYDNGHGHRDDIEINNLQFLFSYRIKDDAAASALVKIIFLVTSGPLRGRYVYIRQTHELRESMKKCRPDSVEEIIQTNDAELLISDTLAKDVFTSPNNGYDVFKSRSHTICTGEEFGL